MLKDKLKDPEQGYTASFVEVQFVSDAGTRYGVATEVFVRPMGFPFALPDGKD